MGNVAFEKLIKKRVNTILNNFSLEINEISQGIVFMFAEWSQSRVQLKYLFDSLESFPEITVYIYDIDEDVFFDFKEKNCLHSSGWGETFWIKNGKIVADLRKYDSEDIQDLIRNNNELIN